MAEQGVLTGQKLYIDQYQLSGRMREIQFQAGIEGQDSTQYSAVAGSSTTQRTEDPGLGFARLEGSALYESNGTDAIDDVLAAGLRASNKLITFCPVTGAQGERAFLMRTFEASIRQGATIGQLLKIDVSARLSDKWMPGTVLGNTIDGIGLGNGTLNFAAWQVGAIAAGKSLYGALHVISCSAAVLTVRIQSDDNSGMTTPVTRATFALGTVGSEWLTPVAGPFTDDWWRLQVVATGGVGLVQLVASMAIK